jgi:hypothetical protein
MMRRGKIRLRQGGVPGQVWGRLRLTDLLIVVRGNRFVAQADTARLVLGTIVSSQKLPLVCLWSALASAKYTVGHSQLSDCTLTFTGVSNLTLPRTQPWGRSQSINSASEPNQGQYEIEMQSGDLIKIDASAVSLTPLAIVG